MAHSYYHALSSAKKWGGVAQDYCAIHSWMDESKVASADFRHRVVRHHSQGLFSLEQVFGITITNSNGRAIPVRLLGEQHLKEDFGFIPTLSDWVRCIRPEPWMGRPLVIERDLEPIDAAK